MNSVCSLSPSRCTSGARHGAGIGFSATIERPWHLAAAAITVLQDNVDVRKAGALKRLDNSLTLVLPAANALRWSMRANVSLDEDRHGKLLSPRSRKGAGTIAAISQSGFLFPILFKVGTGACRAEAWI